MHCACMHVNTCTYIPHTRTHQQQSPIYTQKYINLWLWPKRPPLAFLMAEMSVAEMSWPKCPWPKRPWPKYPTFISCAFDFAIRTVQSLFYLNSKFQASSYLLWLYSPVCVGPGRKPRRPVFSERGSFGS